MTLVTRVPIGNAARGGLAPTEYIEPGALQQGTLAERGSTELTSRDERFSVGIWEAQPYAELVVDHSGYEYTLILEGRVRLTNDDGTSATFGPGDSFTISHGWSGEYRVLDPLLKHYALYTPEGTAA